MTEPRERTDAEVWRALEATADEVDLARVDALSDEDVERELRAAGVTPEEIAAIGADLVGAGSAGSEGRARDAGDARSRTGGRRRSTALRVAGVAAALVAVAAVVFVLRRPDPNLVSRPPPPRDDAAMGYAATLARAAALREQAYAACARREWSACEDALDAAVVLDPVGEADPRTQRARRDVEEHRGE